MNPVIDLAGAELSAYRLFTVTGIAVGFMLAVATTVRRGTPIRAALVVVGVALGAGLVGARLFEAATAADAFLDEPDRLFGLRAGDMAIYGGVAGAVIAGWLVVRVFGLAAPTIADHLAPALGVGIATVRVGCFLAGCCFGTETDLPIGVRYPAGSQPALFQIDGGWSLFQSVHPVHPVPLYEIAAALVAAAAAYVVLRRGARAGSAIAVLAVIYSSARLLIHPVRAAVDGGLPSAVLTVLYVLPLLAAIAWLVPLVASRYRGAYGPAAPRAAC